MRKALDAVGTAKTATKRGVSTRTMAAAGRVNTRLPDVDVDTGRVGNRLSDLPPAARGRVVRNMNQLNDGTKRYLAETDVANPGTKTAKLIEVSGSGGRKALDALASTNRRAADALLRLADDAATQRAMVRAWERGDLSTTELATSLRRYNAMDAGQRADFRDFTGATGPDGMKFVNEADEDTLDVLFGNSCSIGVPSLGGPSIQSENFALVSAGESSFQLSSGDCASWELLKTAVQRSDADLESIAPKLNQLGDDALQSVVRRSAQRPAVVDSLDELSTSQIRDLVGKTEGEELADALELHASDVEYDTVVGIADSDNVDIGDINRGLRVHDSNEIEISSTDFEGARGDLAESLAYEKVRQEYPEASGYEVAHEVYLKDAAGRDAGELDYVVLDRNGNVVEIVEVKSVSGKSGTNQLSIALNRIRSGNVDSVQRDDITIEQFESNLDTIKKNTVGPANDGGYDVNLDLSDAELNALTKAVRERTSNQ